VGDPGDELAERGHFFRLEELGLDQPLPGNVAVDFEPAQPRTVGLVEGPGEAFNDFSRRADELEFIPTRLLTPANMLAPSRRGFRRTEEMVPQAADHRVNGAEFQQAARFKSKDGCEPVARYAYLPIGVEQQHAGFDGVEKAGQLNLQALVRFAQCLLRSLILDMNEPPCPIAAHSGDLASKVHANDAAPLERRLQRHRGKNLFLLHGRRGRRMEPVSPLDDRIARHGGK
jgi:hypothetical protein